MTKEEWGKIVKKICDFYPRYDFMDKQDVFDAWYSLLEDLEYPATVRAVENYVKGHQYPPTIADIRQEYQVLLDGYNALLKDVKNEFELANSYYPKPDDTAYDLFLEKIKKNPQREWRSRARAFKNKTDEYVRQGEINRMEFPSFRDYINEQAI